MAMWAATAAMPVMIRRSRIAASASDRAYGDQQKNKVYNDLAFHEVAKIKIFFSNYTMN